MSAALDRRSPWKVLESINDEAASMVMDGGMLFEEFWRTPRRILEPYKAALMRREEAIEKRSKRRG